MHLRFHPLELLERLASLTPRPQINLVLYNGVLAAHAAWRPRLPLAAGAAGVAASSATAVVRETAADAATGAAPATPAPVDAGGGPGSNRV